MAALRLSKEEFAASVNSEWHGRIMDYDAGKALGYKKPTHDLAVKLLQCRRSRTRPLRETWKRKLAAAIAAEIDQWEKETPVIETH